MVAHVVARSRVKWLYLKVINHHIVVVLQRKKAPFLVKETELFDVGVKGFEPSTPCSQSRCANRAAPHPEILTYLK